MNEHVLQPLFNNLIYKKYRQGSNKMKPLNHILQDRTRKVECNILLYF